MKSKYFFLSIGVFILFNCSEGKKNSPVKNIEKAHQKESFLSKEAIQFDLLLSFGGKERINAKLTLTTNSSKGLIEFNNGDSIFIIEDKVFYSDGMNEKKVRFDAYTWSYFFLFPYKLSDNGTIWSTQTRNMLREKQYNTQKLTFEDGIGDAPKDWYYVYSGKKDNLIQVAAYIVTANKSQKEAEMDPHAIEYLNYNDVDGIPLSHNWKFWGWNKTEGLTKQLGEATLSNFNWMDLDSTFFVPPAHFLTN